MKAKFKETLNINTISKHNTVSKYCSSFFVLRWNKFVYCVYYSGHINITGIETENNIAKSINHIVNVCNISETHSFKIDNITYSNTLKRNIFDTYVSFEEFVSEIDVFDFIISVQYSPQKFPGAFLRTEKGTIIIFSSNKYTIVGTSSFKELYKCNSRMHKIENTLLKH